ncbi:DNA polymerase III subunit delta, partial [bacterium]|nr:DNA polymerase III subunit delta [bacterium]
MQIYPDKLAAALKTDLAPGYFVAGDDVLLQQEACDLVREAAKRQGFNEHHRSVVESGFNWG